MTKDPEYLKEFRTLLHTLRGHVASLRKEKQKLLEENRSLEESLGQALERESNYASPQDSQASESTDLFAELADPSTRKELMHADLFEGLGESERIAMRQHIRELIGCIDSHLSNVHVHDEQTVDSGDHTANPDSPEQEPGSTAAGNDKAH